MKKTFLAVFTAIVALYGSENADIFTKYEGTLRIAGGTAHIPTMKAVAKEIEKSNPRIEVAIAGGGSGVGIKKVGEGLVDIGNAGRAVTDKEKSRYGLVPFKWAIDAIAVAVNPSNPVSNLEREKVIDIFAGRIKNWKEVGGKDAPIDIYTRDSASGTRKVFWKKMLSKGEITPSANFVNSNGAMKRAIANDPNAIGFVSAGFLDDSVKGISVDGIYPDKKHILSGEYGCKRGLYSITKGQPEGLKKAFIDYMLSPHVQHDIVAKKGFIPVR